MTNWLKPRLLALFGAATLIGGATFLHAQNNVPAPAKTPEEAALNFYRVLDAARQSPASPRRDEAPTPPLAGSIERAQFGALSRQDSARFYSVLAAQAASQPFEARVQSASGGETIVLVSPATSPRKRDVVVVAQDGGFRVDAVATYARWNNLSGLDADKSLFRATGFISPALSNDATYLGAATLPLCQSNLKQLGLGIAQYTQDYDEVMPPVRKWQSDDVLYPYLRNRTVYNCPALGVRGNGYAFNSKLSRISLAQINSTSQTIELYETSNPNSNVFAPFTGRAYRHQKDGKDGMNICFADGHVGWFARGQKAELTIQPETTTPGLLPISMDDLNAARRKWRDAAHLGQGQGETRTSTSHAKAQTTRLFQSKAAWAVSTRIASTHTR